MRDPGGKSLRVDVATDEEYVHVSQIALGEDARGGRTTVTLAVADDAEEDGARDGERHALCALTRGTCDQVGMDVVLDASFVLRATGPNDVHVTGWRTANDGIDEEEEARTLEALAMETSSEESETGERGFVGRRGRGGGRDDGGDGRREDGRGLERRGGGGGGGGDDDDFETPYDVENLPSDGDLFSDSESDDDKAFAKAMGVDSEDDLESDEEEESESDSEPAVPERDAVVKVVGGDSDSEDSDEEESDSEESDKPAKTLDSIARAQGASARNPTSPGRSPSRSPTNRKRMRKRAIPTSPSQNPTATSRMMATTRTKNPRPSARMTAKVLPTATILQKATATTRQRQTPSSGSDDSLTASSDDESSDSDVSEDINVIKSATKRLAETSTPSGSAKKQKKESTPASAKASTTPKTPTTDTKMNSDEYANLIVDYLKANPETMMSALGGRVKKPKNFPLKLGEFIKSRKDLFTIDGAYVRLVKK